MNIIDEEMKIFSQLKEQNPDIIQDGIIDESKYINAPVKIAYILKEANGGKGWSLAEFISGGGRRQTWDNVARWTEGIFKIDKELKWTYLESQNEKRRLEYLKYICAVNIKKTSGSYVSNSNEIKKAAVLNGEIITKQINLYAPDIIICCGTADEFIKLYFKNTAINWNMTSRGIWYAKNGTSTVISYLHPQARVKDCILYYGIVDAVKEIFKDRV